MANTVIDPINVAIIFRIIGCEIAIAATVTITVARTIACTGEIAVLRVAVTLKTKWCWLIFQLAGFIDPDYGVADDVGLHEY